MELTMSEKEILNGRIRDIDARLAEIDVALASRPKDGSYQRQELLTEQRELKTHRRVAERALSALSAPPPTPDARRQRFIDAEVATRRQGHVHYIQQLERVGDHRQARIWRNELLNLRAQVEREFPA
jgi:hypothetical protein